jgi:Leucine Rich repeat
MKTVRWLLLKNTAVTDDGLAYLSDWTQLQVLHLSCTKVTRASLPVITKFTDLILLDLGGLPLNDDDVAAIKPLKKLNILYLCSTKITDKALDHLLALPVLQTLYIEGTGLTDMGLATMQKIKGLKLVRLQATKITAKGVADLQRALPDCKVEWDGAPSAPAAVDPDRKAAQWVLSIGGHVWARTKSGEDRNINPGEDLPSERFEAIGAYPSDTPQSADRVTDEGLANLRGLRSLKVVRLDSCAKVTDEGLKSLVGMPALEEVVAHFVPLSDRGAEFLASIPTLKSVNLGETGVGDAGLEDLCRNLPNLRWIAIGPSTTDEGLRHLARAKSLTNLANLKPYHLTDKGIANLEKLSGITALNVVSATDTALQQVAKLTLVQQLHFNLCEATPAGLRPLTKLLKLDLLNFGDSEKIGNDHLEVVGEMTRLASLSLSQTAVTDAGLPHLRKLVKLEVLYLRGTKVTAAGVADLQKALPECKIDWDGAK